MKMKGSWNPTLRQRQAKAWATRGLLQSYEQEDEYYWEAHRDGLKEQHADPDDVFFKARERRQEIKQQIKTLQAGLARQSPRRPKAKKRRARKKQSA